MSTVEAEGCSVLGLFGIPRSAFCLPFFFSRMHVNFGSRLGEDKVLTGSSLAEVASFMPLPPPPRTALTRRGKPTLSPSFKSLTHTLHLFRTQQ